MLVHFYMRVNRKNAKYQTNSKRKNNTRISKLFKRMVSTNISSSSSIMDSSPKRGPGLNIDKRRSHSLCSLQSEENVDLKLFKKSFVHRTCSDSSVDFCMHSDGEEYKRLDSGICDRMSDGDMLVVLEQKIDRLSDMFLEQCRLLNTMKEEICSSKLMIQKTEHAHNTVLVDMLKSAISQRVKDLGAPASTQEGGESMNSRAKSLLSAIESRREVTLNREIRDSLISFLQSEELKEQMVRATAESVRSMISGCFSHDMSTLYLPILERSHRRLIGHIHRVIEQAFVELEDKSSSLFKSVHKTSGALRHALERHQCLLQATADPGKNIVNTLQCTVEELLQSELKDWRQKVLDMFSPQFQTEALPEPETAAAVDYVPASTPQPTNPEVSIIDQLMKTAVINKQIQAGDVNGSFERALCAADLSLVMAACRSADPDLVFAPPCRLQQHVLLSLIQQLATDMLHETQLKCRYLEEALINLNMTDPETRAHVPLVVGEVRKHLSKFLTTYPNHVASRRITLIVMAANNLLK